MKFIKSSRIYFHDEVKNGFLAIDGKKIVGYLASDAPVCNYEDYGDQRIIPGIFDTHNHGTYGYNPGQVLSDKEAIKENIKNYLKALAYEGVTGILPTVVETIQQVAEVSQEVYQGAKILGIHSEGPYLNRVGEGGRPQPYPNVELNVVKQMWEDSNGLLKLVAISPEIENSQAAVDYWRSQGVKIAYAHSDLKAEGARKAVDNGYEVATHTANVMVGLHHRDIGGLGVMLTDKRIECEVICDGLHVDLDFVDIMFKIKGQDRFMMISDSTHLAGIKPGRYEVGWVTPMNVTDEGFIRDDDGRLLGSSKSVLFGISNLVEKNGHPLSEVIKMASLNPAIYYGYGENKGSIEIGKDADLVVISDDYQAVATYVEGELVFDANTEEKLFNPNFKI